MKKQEILASATLTAGAGGTLQFSEARNSMNGILLAFKGNITFAGSDKASITYVPPAGTGKTETLLSSIPIYDLANLTDLLYGAPKARLTTGESIESKINQTFVYIDLGYINLDGGAKLECRFEFGAKSGRDTKVTAYSILNNEVSNIMKHYFISDLSTHAVSHVRHLFLLSDEGFDETSVLSDINISLVVDGSQHNSDVLGYAGCTALFDSVETALPDGIIHIFQDNEGLPSEVSWKYSGNGVSTVKTLVITDVLVPTLVSNHSIRQTERLISKVSSFELAHPELARAYRHAGITKKSSDYGNFLAVMRK